MACNLAERFDVSTFLHEGAFYRSSEGLIYLWLGHETDPSAKSRENTVFWMPFFGTQVQSQSYKKHFLCSVAEFTRLVADFLHSSEPSERGPEKLNLRWEGPSEASFQRSFQDIKGKILREELEKAVPIVCKRAALSAPSDFRGRTHARQILKSLEAPPSLHVFGFWGRSEGVLGMTPEILFQRQGRRLTSMALAGTCPKNEVLHRTPLLKDEKELKEHQAVVDDLLQKLSQFGRARVSAPEVFELPTLWHLKSDLVVEDFRADEKEVIFSLHPTPALGVSPRNYGHHWLKELPDQQNRGLFGGPVAFPLGPEEMVCLVVIRSLFWKEEELTIYAGCGLVQQSEFSQEWKELQAKLQSIEQLLGLDQL